MDEPRGESLLDELLTGIATLIGATAVLLLVLVPSLLLITLACAWGYLPDDAFAPASVLAATSALLVSGAAVFGGRFEPHPRRPGAR